MEKQVVTDNKEFEVRMLPINFLLYQDEILQWQKANIQHNKLALILFVCFARKDGKVRQGKVVGIRIPRPSFAPQASCRVVAQ